MVITKPTIDDFSDTTVMRVIRKIVEYIIDTLVPAINEGGGGSSYVLPPATKSTLGGIIVGNNLTVDGSGKVNAPAPYTLPIASADTLGGVKIGNGVDVGADGTISVNGGSGGITLITDALSNHVIIDSGTDTVTIPKSLLIEYIIKDDELLPTGRYRSAVGFVPAQTITNLSGAGTITLGYAKLENETGSAGYLQIKSKSGYSGMGVVITDQNTTPASLNTDKINSDTIAIGSPPYYECYRVYVIG